MKSKQWIIYCHTHIDSGRKYIGLTSRSMNERWKDHVYAAKSSKGGRWHFPNAIRKYGKDAFSHEILKENIKTLEEANELEKEYIKEFDTRNLEKGFNLTEGGEHSLIQDQHSFREKASESAKNMWKIPGMRERISKKNKAHIFTLEHKQKLSASGKGKIISPEIREKIKFAQKGKPRNPDSIAKSAKSRIGIIFSPEHRANIGKVQIGRKHSPEHTAKVILANKSRPKPTHCKSGHSLENSYMIGGRRFCKACQCRRTKQYLVRRKQKILDLSSSFSE
jgi:hypothetical protein